MTAIGLGATVFLLLFSVVMNERQFPWPIGLVPFFIGLAMIVNGYLFTIPKGESSREYAPERSTGQLAAERAQLTPPPSVVERTTNLLEHERADEAPVHALRSRDTN